MGKAIGNNVLDDSEMGSREDWEAINRLGGGGQSDVFLVRNPERRSQREKCLKQIRLALDGGRRAELAAAVWSYARPDLPSELGALKVFKIPPEEPKRLLPPPDSEEGEAIERLKNEITVLNQARPGLPKLVDSNVAQRWIVTEFFPAGTLERSLSRFRGKAAVALRTFRTLVKTVAALHQEGYVHRDIKPANVFIGTNDDLVLGDFGILYVPDAAVRVTRTGERVGPRDCMPPWAHLGTRLEKVEPCFDVYMLGKLLWSMVDGRAYLPREYHKEPEFDLTRSFPNDPDMYLVNKILDKCVVEQPNPDMAHAQELLLLVETVLGVINRRGQLLTPEVPRPCHICGRGFYQPEVSHQFPEVGRIRFWFPEPGGQTAKLAVRTFVCDTCGHVELFKTLPAQ